MYDSIVFCFIQDECSGFEMMTKIGLNFFPLTLQWLNIFSIILSERKRNKPIELFDKYSRIGESFGRVITLTIGFKPDLQAFPGSKRDNHPQVSLSADSYF
jgi:hypothetical protein